MRVQKLNTETVGWDDVTGGASFRLALGEHTTIDIEDRGGGLLGVRTNGGRIVIKPEVSNSVEVSVG